jgi:biotin-(acetyl-CoA carboxylase) ligase
MADRYSSDEVRDEHMKRKAALAQEIEAQEFWANTCDQKPFKDMVNQFKDTIQRCRVELETAKSEEIKKAQADIASRKELIIMLESGKSFNRVTEARRRLEEFEKSNGLFIIHGD